MILTGKNGRTWREKCNGDTSFTTWTAMGSNLGLCGERRATNRMSHGTASLISVMHEYCIFISWHHMNGPG